jgi:hypothetical protein
MRHKAKRGGKMPVMSPDVVPWLSEKAPTALVSAAGEYYVMTQLLLRGALAALTPRGAKDTDILVTSMDGRVVAEVQVKARSGRSGNGWRMSEKNEAFRDRLFYCFVDFGHASDWPIYVMHSEVVATYLRETHRTWLETPGRRGQQRNDWSGRFISPDKPRPKWLDEHRDRWELILGVTGLGESMRLPGAPPGDRPPGRTPGASASGRGGA